MRIRTISIIAAAIGIFMAVGCKKESEGITLGASIANDDNLTKVHLSTTDQPLWDNGDPVWVNGDDTRTISDISNTDGTNAKIKGVTTSSSYLAIYPADMAAGGNGLWMNSAVSGTATTTAITWGQTTPTDGVHTWNGWRNNRLYFTDGSQFVIPSDVQVIRGDVNNDGAVNISDVTALINALLSSNLAPSATFSPENADCNKDGNLSIADVTSLINYLLSQNWPN